MAPGAVTMAIEDADFSVDGPRRAAVAVAVESDGLDKILMAVLPYLEPGGLVHCGRFWQQGRRHVESQPKYGP